MARLGRRKLLKLGLLSSLGGVGLSMLAVNDVERLTVTRLEVGLPAKVVFVTDLHIHVRTPYYEGLADIISSEEPDVLVIGGDTIDEYTVDRAYVEAFLKSLNAKEKFAVMGNHEYWAGQVEWLASILKMHGFKLLFNTTGESMAGRVMGLDWSEIRRYPSIVTDGLVFVHDPNAAHYLGGRCLILAGHTHGGLVIGETALYSNSYYVRGLYRLDSGPILYVSRGLGQIFPIRINSPPEILIVS
ncbi:MAG: metallophosphoesterase [Nitrososphaerota archaeon]